MSVSPGGLLRLIFESDPWNSSISFEPGISVELGGTLELDFAADVQVSAQVGRTFDIFDWYGVDPTGAFDVTSPYLWDLSKLYTTGEVRFTGTGGVGDLDGNGRVDQRDLDRVLLNWGTDGAVPMAGWINDLAVGLVDQTELDRVLLNWSMNWDAVLPPASVPEPSSLVIITLAALAVCGYARCPRLRMSVVAASKCARHFTTETPGHGDTADTEGNCKLTIESFQLSICNSALCGLVLLFAASPANDSGAAEYTPLYVSGSPANRVDVLLIGDGYTSEQLATEYRPHVDSLVEYLFGGAAGEPFFRYRNFFNVHEVAVASSESGADAHRFDGPFRDTALGAAYYYDGLNDQHLDIHWAEADRIAAEAAPREVWDSTDIRVALVNDTTFGGTGGTWATYAAGYRSAYEIAAHEIGHTFTGLADEYFTAGTTYTGIEPQVPNVTTGTDKWDRWLGYVDPDHPELGPVGYYEGGRYHQFGIYRPTRTSRMFSVHEPWNAVSREAIIEAIYRSARPLDDWLASGETLVNPQDLWVESIDASVFAFEWFIDGDKVSGADGEMLDVSGLRRLPGEHTVRVRVYDRVLDHTFTGDNLDWWRKDDSSTLAQDVVWTIRTTLAGDYDGDGTIDQGDLDLVLLYWGQPALSPPPGWVEDLPRGNVSQTQLDPVLLNWGRLSGTMAAASIPEPATAALVAVALAVLGCLRHLRPPTPPHALTPSGLDQIQRRLAAVALRAAVVAGASDDQAMAAGAEFVLGRDRVAELLQLLALKLDELVADLAVEVVVLRVAVVPLVDAATLEGHRPQQARLDQLGQRAIDGRAADLPALFFLGQHREHVVCVKVVVVAKDQIDQITPLLRGPLAAALQILVKPLLGVESDLYRAERKVPCHAVILLAAAPSDKFCRQLVGVHAIACPPAAVIEVHALACPPAA
jgi:hypothetical protein